MALTAPRVLRDRILLTLSSPVFAGGSAARAELLAAMDTAYAEEWSPEDQQTPAKRPWESKWRNRASFERAHMVRDGLLSADADGRWTLTVAGHQAADAIRADTVTARDAELGRREAMWASLLSSGGPENVPASLVDDLRIFRGVRGIYAHGESTRGPLGVDGVTVSFLHNGSSCADELSVGGVRYHYPRTGVPGRDAAEVSASRAAYALGLPIFVVTTGVPDTSRTVYRGYIEDYDDDLAMFLVTFTDKALPPPPPPPAAATGLPFALTSGDDRDETWTKRRSRPNQQRFAFQVMQRYGATCAVCHLGVPSMLNAAHLRAKKDKGSDDPRNGLPLCANHHVAFDGGLWSIEPGTHRLVAKDASGPSLSDLQITRSDLAHLAQLPHAEAVQYVWKRWSGALPSPSVAPAPAGT